MKFGRIYSMQIEGKHASFIDGSQHKIAFPLTCKLRIEDTCTYAGSKATFQIYNLSPDTRRDINKDAYEFATYRKVIFAAGYQTELPLPVVFKGNVLYCYSYRQGPDWITEMACQDGGYLMKNAQINLPVPSPYDFKRFLSQIVDTMNPYHVTPGVIGEFIVPNTRGIVFCGNTWDLLTQTMIPFRAQVTINREKVYIINQNEYIAANGAVTVIDADTGLLESPKHQQALMICKMLFEPRFKIFQLVNVQSIEPANSGMWKVMQAHHTGTISGAVSEDLNTFVTVFRTPEQFVQAQAVAA